MAIVKSAISLILTVLTTVTVQAQKNTYVVKAPTNGEDMTLYVRNALIECRKNGISKIRFEKGTYQFNQDLATEKYVFTCNNDEGLKRIAFDLSGFKHFEFDGGNSNFIFDGYISPFLLHKTSNITIKNLSIDYKRTFHSEGIIRNAYTDSLDVEFTDDYPYQITNNKLMFVGKNIIGTIIGGAPKRLNYPFWHILEFDAIKREPETSAVDYLNVQNIIAKELKSGIVRISKPGLKGKVGNILIFNASERLIPAIAIAESENTSIKNVTLYHAGGMGIIAQLSKNIVLDSLKVIPSGGRMVSLTADATHFVNCDGNIVISNCTFMNQMDDATNIHGVYFKVNQIISNKEIILRISHYQQFGFAGLTAGKSIEFVNPLSLITLENNRVKRVNYLNKEYVKVFLEKSISSGITNNNVLCLTNEQPNVLIQNCTIKNNRARGMLLGSRAKIEISNNYFHTHCSAIHMEGDANFWFEQAGVRNLVIKNNVFDNCNYSSLFGTGVITVGAGISENYRNVDYYNKNIRIEDNTFKISNDCILNIYCVDGLSFQKNKIERIDTETPQSPVLYNFPNENFLIKNSKNISISK